MLGELTKASRCHHGPARSLVDCCHRSLPREDRAGRPRAADPRSGSARPLTAHCDAALGSDSMPWHRRDADVVSGTHLSRPSGRPAPQARAGAAASPSRGHSVDLILAPIVAGRPPPRWQQEPTWDSPTVLNTPGPVAARRTAHVLQHRDTVFRRSSRVSRLLGPAIVTRPMTACIRLVLRSPPERPCARHLDRRMRSRPVMYGHSHVTFPNTGPVERHSS